jgi:hypothetical protein
MPPSNAAIAAAIIPRSKPITPKTIAKRARPPPHVAIRETKMNLPQLSILAVIFDECLEVGDLIAGIAVSFVTHMMLQPAPLCAFSAVPRYSLLRLSVGQ